MIWPRLIYMLLKLQEYAAYHHGLHDDECCINPALNYITFRKGVDKYMDPRTPAG